MEVSTILLPAFIHSGNEFMLLKIPLIYSLFSQCLSAEYISKYEYKKCGRHCGRKNLPADSRKSTGDSLAGNSYYFIKKINPIIFLRPVLIQFRSGTRVCQSGFNANRVRIFHHNFLKCAVKCLRNNVSNVISIPRTLSLFSIILPNTSITYSI